MTIELFDLLTPATDGIKLPLTLPDGSDSGYWLHIRGRDAEIFRRAEFDAQHKIKKLAERGVTDFDAIESARLDMQVSLVIGWNLDEDFTPDAVRRLLRVAPHIAEVLDKTAWDRALFFRNASGNSTSTPDGPADSNGAPTAASSLSEKVSNRSSAPPAAARTG